MMPVARTGESIVHHVVPGPMWQITYACGTCWPREMSSTRFPMDDRTGAEVTCPKCLAATPPPESPMQIADGFHQLTREQYDAIPATNHSRLRWMGKSPAHYAAQPAIDREATPAQARGSLLSLGLLEPHVFLDTVVVWRGGRRDKRNKEWAAFEAEHADKIILTEEEHRECVALSRAVRSHSKAGGYLADGRGEVTMVWTLDNGRRCKARLDWLRNEPLILDLKSTRDGSEEGYAREAWKYNVPSQSAWYHDGYQRLTGTAPRYVLIVVEAEMPHVVCTREVGEDVLCVGRAMYNKWLAQLDACEQSGQWPGYPSVPLRLPPWATGEGETNE